MLIPGIILLKSEDSWYISAEKNNKTRKRRLNGQPSHPYMAGFPVWRPGEQDLCGRKFSVFAERTIDTYDILPEQYAAEEEDAA